MAFMDAWWNHMIDEVLPQITAVEDLAVMVGGRHNAPGGGGSAFQGGYYGYILRVLEMALGRKRRALSSSSSVRAPARRRIAAPRWWRACGRPSRSLGTDMSAWDPTLEADDAIDHTALGLADPPNIHWQNRPTWQQVIQPTVDALR